MHYRMFVTTSLPDGGGSQEARLTVHDALSHDDSFCGNGGRFGSPFCDSFEIGGRWSGVLEATIGPTYRAAVAARFHEMADDWSPYRLVDAHHHELDALWQSCGGCGSSPYTRDTGGMLGHADDAMLVTRELYDAMLACYEGESKVIDGCHCQYIDLDDEPLQADAIGSKWLVVVDYHN